MKKIRWSRTMVALVCALILPVAAHAQLDCEALANSPLAEPPGYAEQCLGHAAPAPAGGAPEAPTDTGYKYDMRNTVGLYSYQVGSFPTQTFIANPFVVPQTGYGWDFDAAGTTLWAHNATTNAFGTVNTATGAFTPVTTVTLPGAQTFSGLAIDPSNDVFYVSGTDGAISTIYTLNPATGAVTPLGNTGTALMIDIAMNCDGELYGHDIATDSLYSIDTTTGAATLIGGHGLAANFAQGMDFDNDDGTLYGCIYTGGGTNTYAAWNTATGAIVPINTNSPLGEWECAIPTTCPVLEADLAITKSATEYNVSPGDTIVFTVLVENLGPADAINVVVTDTLPAGLTLVATSGCAEDPTGVPTCSLGTILAGGSASYTVTVTVAAGATGLLTNTVTVSAENADPVTANNTGAAQVLVERLLLDIPTLSGVGLAVLVALLLGGGLLLLRRRRLS